MKKLINTIITVIILALLIWFVYVFFIDCEKYEYEFERFFTLQEMDQAKIGDEVIVKLININDERYIDDDGKEQGICEFKLLIINDMRFAYVTVDTFEKQKVDTGKLKYIIELVEMKDDETVTFSLSKTE